VPLPDGEAHQHLNNLSLHASRFCCGHLVVDLFPHSIETGPSGENGNRCCDIRYEMCRFLCLNLSQTTRDVTKPRERDLEE
jgi:hypothetical protein